VNKKIVAIGSLILILSIGIATVSAMPTNGGEVCIATVKICPQALNLRSRGKWITAYVEIPGYDPHDINVSSMLMNITIPAEPKPKAIGDYDNDGIPDLMVKFDRAEVVSYVLANVNVLELIEERFMSVTLTLTGKLNDGTPFQGNDTIEIVFIMPRWGRL